MHADVLIVGGGPAGSTAALTLARQGFDVLVLDKATFPRPKLCGGLLTWKAIRLLEHLHGADSEGLPACLCQKGIVDTITDGFAIFHHHRLLARGRCAYPFHLIRRPEMDAFLLDKARQAGARIMESCTVQECAPDGTLTTDHGRLRGRYLIGADGANSVVRRSFHLPRGAWTHNLGATVEITIPRELFPRDLRTPELYTGVLRAGYGWVFPNRQGVIVGIGGLPRHTPNFRTAFRNFLHLLGVVDTAAVLATCPLHGHPLPYGNAIRRPAQGTRLLAGDAGGFVEPLLGEGIFYALLTGWYAGEAVAGALTTGTQPGLAYEQRLRRYVWPELHGSNRLRWMLYMLDRKARPGVMGQFFRLGTIPLAEVVHGIRSYSWGRRKNWDF